LDLRLLQPRGEPEVARERLRLAGGEDLAEEALEGEEIMNG